MSSTLAAARTGDKRMYDFEIVALFFGNDPDRMHQARDESQECK